MSKDDDCLEHARDQLLLSMARGMQLLLLRATIAEQHSFQLRLSVERLENASSQEVVFVPKGNK